MSLRTCFVLMPGLHNILNNFIVRKMRRSNMAVPYRLPLFFRSAFLLELIYSIDCAAASESHTVVCACSTSHMAAPLRLPISMLWGDFSLELAILTPWFADSEGALRAQRTQMGTHESNCNKHALAGILGPVRRSTPATAEHICKGPILKAICDESR